MSPVVHYCIRGVAGNAENAQMRMPRRKPLGEFHAACARQDNVCEQDIDVEGLLSDAATADSASSATMTL